MVLGVVRLLVGLGSLYPLDFVWSLSTMSAGVAGAAFTAPIILGLYWKRATKEGCYAGIIGGADSPGCFIYGQGSWRSRERPPGISAAPPFRILLIVFAIF